MTESEHRRLDIRIKSITLLAVVLGSFLGLLQYNDQVEKDFRKPYWEQKIQLYFKASQAVSVLATSQDQKQIEKATDDFWVLYFGPLVMVEDQKVVDAMIAVGRCLESTCPDLTKLSLTLSKALRNSIGETWDVELDELPDKLDSFDPKNRK